MAFRLYNQLEEVRQRKAIEERQQIYAQNREKRKEFEKVSPCFDVFEYTVLCSKRACIFIIYVDWLSLLLIIYLHVHVVLFLTAFCIVIPCIYACLGGSVG